MAIVCISVFICKMDTIHSACLLRLLRRLREFVYLKYLERCLALAEEVVSLSYVQCHHSAVSLSQPRTGLVAPSVPQARYLAEAALVLVILGGKIHRDPRKAGFQFRMKLFYSVEPQGGRSCVDSQDCRLRHDSRTRKRCRTSVSSEPPHL